MLAIRTTCISCCIEKPHLSGKGKERKEEKRKKRKRKEKLHIRKSWGQQEWVNDSAKGGWEICGKAEIQNCVLVFPWFWNHKI